MLPSEAEALHNHLTHGLHLYRQLVQGLSGANRQGQLGADSRMFQFELQEVTKLLDSCSDKLGNIAGGLKPDHYAAKYVVDGTGDALSATEPALSLRWDQAYWLRLYGHQLERKRTPPPGTRRREANRKFAGIERPPLGNKWENPQVKEY